MPHQIFRFSSFFLVSLTVACAPVSEDEVIVTETIVAGSAETGAEVPVSADVDETDVSEPGLADIELCEADAFRPLIGSSIAATALPEDPLLRAFGENDIVTQDYRPQRTNILYDVGGTIIRVYCG